MMLVRTRDNPLIQVSKHIENPVSSLGEDALSEGLWHPEEIWHEGRDINPYSMEMDDGIKDLFQGKQKYLLADITSYNVAHL